VKGKLWWVAFVADDWGGTRTPVVMWYGIQNSAELSGGVCILGFLSVCLFLSLHAVSLWTPHFYWWKPGSKLSVRPM